MDILGIGFAELIFILMIAMIVFGPRRLPEMAAKAGKIVRDLRNMSHGLMNEWQREITASAHLEELKKTRDEIYQAKEDLSQIGKSVSKDVKNISTEVNKEVKSVSEQLAPKESSMMAPIKQVLPQTESSKDEDETAKDVAVEPDTPLDETSPASPSNNSNASTPSTHTAVGSENGDNQDNTAPVQSTRSEPRLNHAAVSRSASGAKPQKQTQSQPQEKTEKVADE